MGVYTDKENGRLFIKFKYQGNVYKRRLPAKTKLKDARDMETTWRHELFNEAHGQEKKRNILYEDFLKDYFLPFAEANHSADSFERDVLICKESLKFFKGKQMRRIKPADIELYKNYRAKLPTQRGQVRKPATLLRDLSVLSKVFSLAVKNDFIDYNPYSRVDKPKFDNVQNKILKREDEERFFAEFQPDETYGRKKLVKKGEFWARDVCRFVLNTGLRQNDVLGLKKFNIDRENNLIRLTQGKTRRVVEIPMNGAARAIIDARWNNKSELLFPSPKTGRQGTSVKKACLGASDRAKLGYRVTIKDLRRTFGTRLGELNYSSNVKAKLLGHSDNRSVHRYERESGILREAVEALELQTCAASVPNKKKRKFKTSRK